jgi:CRISPR/Cas system Type II protein with McrA/HNH and RuvC-like nuclease domain
VFVYDDHGEAIEKSKLNISYIRLDSSMNYVSHDIDDYTSNINEKKFEAQLKMLLEMQKTSTLPFFVLFLEHIEDPIKRLIYLFTYMPSLKVRSGK